MYRYIQCVPRCGQRYIKKYIKNSDVLMYQGPIHRAIWYIKSLSKTGGYAPSARLYSADLGSVMPYPPWIVLPMACVCIQDPDNCWFLTYRGRYINCINTSKTRDVSDVWGPDTTDTMHTHRHIHDVSIHQKWWCTDTADTSIHLIQPGLSLAGHLHEEPNIWHV